MRGFPSKILVRAPNWVGDAIMSLPAVRAVRASYPGASLSILARQWVAGIYAHESCVDEVIPYDAAPGWRDLGAKRRIAAMLRARRFDTAILLQNAFEAAALVRAAGIPRRVGYERDGRGWLLTDRVPVPAPGEIPAHERFYYLELLRRSGIIGSLPACDTIRLEGAAQARRAGAGEVRANGCHGSRGQRQPWRGIRHRETLASRTICRNGAASGGGKCGRRGDFRIELRGGAL